MRTNDIDVSGLSYRYGDNLPWVIHSLDIRFAEAEISVLVGSNGSGKSTLARLLARELIPRSGLIHAPDKSRVAYRYQDYHKNLLPWYSAMKNLELLGGSPDNLTENWLSTADFERWCRTKVRSLSGGQKQILSLIIILQLQARLTILDEPFSAIDPKRLTKFWHLTREWTRSHRSTVLLITHNLDEAVSLADKIILIEDLAKGQFTEVSVERPSDAGDFLTSEAGQKLRQTIARQFYAF